MKVILVGCEYAGKTTLADRISEWMVEMFGPEPWGPPHYGWHDHYQMPNVTHHDMTGDEMRQVMALSPRMKEVYQRYNIAYHTPTEPTDGDFLMIGFHIDDAVYGPLYFGYGGEGEYADRRILSDDIESAIMKYQPDTVLVLLKANPDVIKERMKSNAHKHQVIKNEDVELLLERFEEAYTNALMRRRFVIDNSDQTIEETFSEFVEKFEHHMNEADRRRILLHNQWNEIGPLA
jgi:hypothetical protein